MAIDGHGGKFLFPPHIPKESIPFRRGTSCLSCAEIDIFHLSPHNCYYSVKARKSVPRTISREGHLAEVRQHELTFLQLLLTRSPAIKVSRAFRRSRLWVRHGRRPDGMSRDGESSFAMSFDRTGLPFGVGLANDTGAMYGPCLNDVRASVG